ncbi:MAG TPA: hypothetical protein VJS12_06105 [Steroidobacteraceae bacterium]|nr:hypothetical protein [Steroidobacteraceae bacterium]
MHTCLSLSNIGGHWYVERAVAGLISGLNALCDSIEWCNIAVEGPNGDSEARFWRVDLKLRVFDETVRATTRLPEGPDSLQSLSAVLADIQAKATAQMARIAEQHQACCCHRADRIAAGSKACA